MRRAKNYLPPRSRVYNPPPGSNIRRRRSRSDIEKIIPDTTILQRVSNTPQPQIQSSRTNLSSLKQSTTTSTSSSCALTAPSSSCPLPSSSSAPPPLPSPSPTSSTFTSIPLFQEASPVQGVGRLNCPGLSPENRTYAVPGASWLRFRRDCGSNYPGGDIGQLPLTRMEDCLNLCAALQVTVQSVKGRCIGVVWKTATRPSDPLASANYCWLKYAKGQGFADDPEVEAAWIVDGQSFV